GGRPRPLEHVFDRSAQELGHTPGLGHAAAWVVRRGALEDLGGLTEAGLAEGLSESRQPCPHPPAGAGTSARYLPVGRAKRGHEPRPDRALVIGAVAVPGIALIPPSVLRIVRREATQADGREQLAFDHIQDAASFLIG